MINLAFLKQVGILSSFLGNKDNPLPTVAKHALDIVMHDVYPEHHNQHFYLKSDDFKGLITSIKKDEYDTMISFLKGMKSFNLINPDIIEKVGMILDPKFHFMVNDKKIALVSNKESDEPVPYVNHSSNDHTSGDHV